MTSINKQNFFDDILTYKEYRKRIQWLNLQSEFDLYGMVRLLLSKKYSGFSKMHNEEYDGKF